MSPLRYTVQWGPIDTVLRLLLPLRLRLPGPPELSLRNLRLGHSPRGLPDCIHHELAGVWGKRVVHCGYC